MGQRWQAIALAMAIPAVVSSIGGGVMANDQEALPTVDALLDGRKAESGFLSLVPETSGRLLLRLPAPRGPRGEIARMLFVEGLTSGLGSNPIGLDRGQIGRSRLIVLRSVGGRLLVEQPNLTYRALSDDPAEREAVAESFASSVLWATRPVARDPDGAMIVDWAPFLLQDHHGVQATLKATGQGNYSLDPERSVVEFDRLWVFPDNVEIDVTLTWKGAGEGGLVRSVTPSPEAITLRQHLSFVRLPDDGYRPRRFDPRMGSFAVRFQDYAADIADPLERRWIVRHRLQKSKPGPGPSAPVEPIVYYVDRGAPEPIRSALIEGASWWAEAFEAAGFPGGFRVALLPEGAHPLDVRYNVIEWVHRSTRGWSYGGGVVDPRTGERIKGHVSLGSLRVRQDRRIFEGLLGAAASGKGGPLDPVELALARIRQLAAHEVGHTIGLAHNFAASSYGRASVMDYPAPWVRLRGDRLDLSEAYGVGVGAWDRHAIRWAYAEFPEGADEAAELEAIVAQGRDRGWIYLTDADARPAGAAHPFAGLWDNGSDPVAELDNVLAVRRWAMDRFDTDNLPIGWPQALLQETFAPIYFYHRYQLEAAAKSIGGVDYRYAVNGDGAAAAVPVESATQRRALAAVLRGLDVETLSIPQRVERLLLPRPFGYGPNRELFAGRTAPAFDALGAARTGAGLVLDFILQPQRAARLIDQARRDGERLSFEELLRRLEDAVVTGQADPSEAAVGREVLATTVERLIVLAQDERATAGVQAQAEQSLVRLAGRLGASAAGGHALQGYLQARIDRFRERPFDSAVRPAADGPPPGSPIGLAPAWAGCGWGDGVHLEGVHHRGGHAESIGRAECWGCGQVGSGPGSD